MFFLLFFISEAKNTDKYGYCIGLISQKIPIDKNLAETKNIMKRYIQYFNGHPPSYKQKEQICLNNKALFTRVGNDLLRAVNLQNSITDKQMARCISRNLPLFAYTVLYMANGPYSDNIEKIKRDFLGQGNSFTRKVYVTPQIPRPNLDNNDRFFYFFDENQFGQEQSEDDHYLLSIGDEFNYMDEF